MHYGDNNRIYSTIIFVVSVIATVLSVTVGDCRGFSPPRHPIWDLDHLPVGEIIGLEAGDGMTRRYRVTGSRILSKPELVIPTPEAANALMLVTCWPLDGIDPGTAKRFALIAQEMAP